MKLRILGDSLRMRLSQSEVARLRDAGQVDQTIHFGGDEAAAIRYAVAADATGSTITATLEGASINVRIPVGQMRAWADGNDVSLRASQPIGAHGELSILVEKDFKCLVPREGEQDADGYDNPQAD